MKISGAIDFNAPALNYARKDFPLLEAGASVQKALETIRREGIGERVIYFYVGDERERLVGVVDTDIFMESILESEERNEGVRDDFFEALGFHLAQVRGASPWRIFRYRFPWLLVTVAGGTVCAILAGFFEATLARSLIIAFFLIMVLGLNESVSAQSMSVTTQALRSVPVTWQWFKIAFQREITTA